MFWKSALTAVKVPGTRLHLTAGRCRLAKKFPPGSFYFSIKGCHREAASRTTHWADNAHQTWKYSHISVTILSTKNTGHKTHTLMQEIVVGVVFVSQKMQKIVMDKDQWKKHKIFQIHFSGDDHLRLAIPVSSERCPMSVSSLRLGVKLLSLASKRFNSLLTFALFAIHWCKLMSTQVTSLTNKQLGLPVWPQA